MKKGTSASQKIIARIEAEMSLREAMGISPDFILGLKSSIALIDPEYFKEKFLNPGVAAKVPGLAGPAPGQK